jgi:hypothetical protein
MHSAHMSILTRILLVCTVLVVIGTFGFAAMGYPDLPARIPTHFNANGVADGFGPRSNWWFLPGISVASSVLLIGVVLMIPRRPDLLNLPSKPQILALPPAAQCAVVRQAQPGLMMLGFLTAAMVAYLQYASWTVAMGRAASGLGSLVIVVPLVSVALIPALVLPVQRELRRQQAALGKS